MQCKESVVYFWPKWLFNQADVLKFTQLMVHTLLHSSILNLFGDLIVLTHLDLFHLFQTLKQLKLKRVRTSHQTKALESKPSNCAISIILMNIYVCNMQYTLQWLKIMWPELNIIRLAIIMMHIDDIVKCMYYAVLHALDFTK